MKNLTILPRSLGLSFLVIFTTCLLVEKAFSAWEIHTDRPGRDYKNFWISKDIEAFVAAQQCEDACKDDLQCKSFSLVNAGIQGENARCYLKEGVPSPIKSTCCTSGVIRPETKADYCNNYSLDAVKSHISNINWKCGYKGNRWQSNYNTHYTWCMNVSEQHSSEESKKRAIEIDNCLNPSTSGDLSAYDWCWQNGNGGTLITFYPLIRNSNHKWASGVEGYYKIGLGFGPTIMEKQYVLPKFPYLSLQPYEIHTLEGFQLPYHDENEYMVENIWMLSHPEDVDMSNNRNPGIKGVYKGRSFSTNSILIDKKCK